MYWWGWVVVLLLSCIGFVLIFCSLVWATDEGEIVLSAIAAIAAVTFGALAWYICSWAQTPDAPSPRNGYVIGLDIDPAHTERQCSGKVCHNVAIETAHWLDLQGFNGETGWRSVPSEVFTHCHLHDLYEKGRCGSRDEREETG